MTDEKAAAFNAFTANWILRIDSMNNSIILVSGGVMSITIGAFLRSEPPVLGAGSVIQIQGAWVLLAISLACSILLKKCVLVISGAIVLKEWEQRAEVKSDGRIIMDSPKWVHVTAWFLGGGSVVSCLIGFGLISVGAGSLL